MSFGLFGVFAISRWQRAHDAIGGDMALLHLACQLSPISCYCVLDLTSLGDECLFPWVLLISPLVS